MTRVSMTDRIDVAPVRAAFLASGIPPGEVATRLGWTRCKGRTQAGRTYRYVQGDGQRVRRTLGLTAHTGGNGKRVVAKTIDYGRAVGFCHALNLDPYEVGL